MVEYLRAPSGRTPWMPAIIGIALLLPGPARAQTGIDGRTAELSRVTSAPPAAAPAAIVGPHVRSWSSAAANTLFRQSEPGPIRRLARHPTAFVDHRIRQEDKPHPLRGGLATIGGMLAGFGVGLAVDEPAPGLVIGTGLGLVTTAFLRTFGDR